MKKRAKSKAIIHELKPNQPLTARQKQQLQTLATMPEGKIDTSDIPSYLREPGRTRCAVNGIALSSRLYPSVWMRMSWLGLRRKETGIRQK
jgi:hypothetical protein